jgi:hypothetical protein
MRVKISSIRSRTTVKGWRWPGANRPARQRYIDPARRQRVLRVFGVLRPAGFNRLFQLVCAAADAFLLIRWSGGDQLHPPGDDAVFAAEEAIANSLRLARRLCLRELRFERGDLVGDGLLIGKTHLTRLYITKPRTHEATKTIRSKVASCLRGFVASC